MKRRRCTQTYSKVGKEAAHVGLGQAGRQHGVHHPAPNVVRAHGLKFRSYDIIRLAWNKNHLKNHPNL